MSWYSHSPLKSCIIPSKESLSIMFNRYDELFLFSFMYVLWLHRTQCNILSWFVLKGRKESWDIKVQFSRSTIVNYFQLDLISFLIWYLSQCCAYGRCRDYRRSLSVGGEHYLDITPVLTKLRHDKFFSRSAPRLNACLHELDGGSMFRLSEASVNICKEDQEQGGWNTRYTISPYEYLFVNITSKAGPFLIKSCTPLLLKRDDNSWW